MNTSHFETRQYSTHRPLRWVRSNSGWLAGVCAGLGQSFSISPLILRVLWIFSILAFGTGVFVYILLIFALPKEDQVHLAQNEKLLGVCTRLSNKLHIEVGLVRFAALLLLFASFGLTIILYFVLYFVLSDQDHS